MVVCFSKQNESSNCGMRTNGESCSSPIMCCCYPCWSCFYRWAAAAVARVVNANASPLPLRNTSWSSRLKLGANNKTVTKCRAEEDGGPSFFSLIALFLLRAELLPIIATETD